MNLPRTFVLTVDRPIARFVRCAEHLDSLGIKWERFNGFDNTVCKLTPVETFDLDRVGERIGPKHVAATLSHIALWYVMMFQPEDSFIAFEYDVSLPPDFEARFHDEMSVVPPEWDVVMLGSCCTEGREKTHVGKNVYAIREALCGHAFLIRKKALPVLIREQQRIYAPLDIALTLGAFKKLNVFAILPSLVGQAGTPLPP